MRPVIAVIMATAVALMTSAVSGHDDQTEGGGEHPKGVASQDQGLGRDIYARSCSVCHGENGNAASWAKNSLNPPPRDFTSAAGRELSRGQMIHAVTHGVPDTAMMPFTTQLSEPEIAAVVDFILADFVNKDVRSPSELAEKSEPPHEGVHDHHAHHGGTMDMAADFPGTLVGRIDPGKTSYESNCAACHGIEGTGHGPRAYFLSRKPRDFTSERARAELNRPHLFEAIAKGVRQTEMAAWSKVLSAQEIADVAEYVFTAFVHGDRPGTPHHATDKAQHPAKKN